MNDNWRPNGDFRALLSRPNRRQLIRGTGAVAGAAALSGVMPAPSRAEGETLNLLSWPGHGDAAVVKPFEDKYHVKVVAKEYVGGEAMLALINQSPPGSYDVVLADAEYVGMLRDGGFIEQLNPADYPFGDFWPEFQKFEGHWLDGKLYSVITRFGYLGLAYRTDMLSDDDVKSYKILWDPKVKGKVGFFDWYLPSMGCLSLYSGNKPPFDITDAAFAKLKQTLFSLKPEIGGLLSDGGRVLQSHQRHHRGHSRRGGLGRVAAGKERRSGVGDRAGGRRASMDRIALHLFVVPEKGSGQGIYPVHGVARGSGSHRATACLLGIDPEQSGLAKDEC